MSYSLPPSPYFKHSSSSFASSVSSFSNPFHIHVSSAKMDSRVRISKTISAPKREEQMYANVGVERKEDYVVSLREWQDWGTSSPMPVLVAKLASALKTLEKESGARMVFGGLGGKLQGDFKVIEEKKHREAYRSLVHSEDKLRYFSARQIACRLLGGREHLCQKCWLVKEDCMCSELVQSSLWQGIRFWLYMHPKDFLRQNNTGKLLWQVFGIEDASLCIFGIHDMEQIMWDAFKCAGKDMVWVLYPNKNAPTNYVQNIFCQPSANAENLKSKTMNFVLIDGTWNNSSALFDRLKDHGKLLWGEDGIPCISLDSLEASAMHKLRPQPSWDRTCTAAAASGLLSELHLCPNFGTHDLEKQAKAVESGMDVLVKSLTRRRQRMGRPSKREGRREKLC